MNKKLARQAFYVFIIANIVAIWYFSYTDSPIFSIEKIKAYLEGQNLFIALFVYTVVMIIRGLTILPGTPLLVLGGIIFPTTYALVAIQIAVQTYIFIINRFIGVLDFKVPKKILNYEKKIEKHGIPFIILLCIIPGMSMNTMAYLLSTMKVPLKVQMIGIGIGSTINMFIYLNIVQILFNVTI